MISFRLSVYFMFSVYFLVQLIRNVAYWLTRYLENLEDYKSFSWGRAIYEYITEVVHKTTYDCVISLRLITPTYHISEANINSAALKFFRNSHYWFMNSLKFFRMQVSLQIMEFPHIKPENFESSFLIFKKRLLIIIHPHFYFTKI